MDQIIGWMGTFLIVISYTLNVLKVLKSESYTYLFMNLMGAFALGVSVYYKQAWPNVFMEIVWFGVAFVGIIKALRK